jgi:hypothetical protein
VSTEADPNWCGGDSRCVYRGLKQDISSYVYQGGLFSSKVVRPWTARNPEPEAGIELTTYALRVRCSTTEPLGRVVLRLAADSLLILFLFLVT